VTASPSQLEYAPRRPFVRRRWKSLTLLALLLLAIMGTIVFRAQLRTTYSRINLLRLQRNCLTFTAPPGQIAYDETPDAAALLNRPGYRQVGVGARTGARLIGWQPVEFTQFWPLVRHPTAKGNGAVLFLGERVSPKGNRRLVYLAGDPLSMSSAGRLVPFEAYEVELGTWNTNPIPRNGLAQIMIEFSEIRGQPLRIYAGQPDPKDPSHFTIDYEIAGRRGTIDGYLRDRTESPDGIPLVTAFEFTVRPGGPTR
jgi:hypothetical protein